MLSVEKDSDHPSCSLNSLAVETNERAPQGIDCQEADPLVLDHNTAPNFSLRDYVFESRGKHIETNWPFARPFLRLCLKSGIRDLLPPFEPPNFVRAQCLEKFVEPGYPRSSSDAAKISEDVDLLEPEHVSVSNLKEVILEQKSCSQCEEQLLDSTNKATTSSYKNSKSKVNQAVDFDKLVHTTVRIVSTSSANEHPQQTSDHVTVAVDRCASELSLESEVAELSNKIEKFQEPSEKKCKLTVKLTAISETSCMDDLTSNISSVSDPMASKVCPVCKAFSSSSNTTLNAHIDQCLSMDSNTKIESNSTILKAKPRKKRLMVDIYSNAPHCTLEDLDRRNGTNWAVELALSVTPPSDAVADTKRPKLALPEPCNKETDDAVYVDSNGIKLRILSKFNDRMPLLSDDIRAKNNMQEKNMTKKKEHFVPNFNKKMKMMAESKKSYSLKVFKHQMRYFPERDHDTENNQTADHCLSLGRNARASFKDGERLTIKQQQSSGYCNDVGKLYRGDTYDNTGNERPFTRNLTAENRHSPEFHSSFPRGHGNKVLKSTTLPTGSPKTKRVEFICRAVDTKSGENRPSETPTSDTEQCSECSLSGNGFLPVSSSKDSMSLANKGLSMHTRVNGKSRYSSQVTSTPPNTHATKHRANSTLTKNQFSEKPFLCLVARKGEACDQPSSSKVLRKHRSVLRTNKRIHLTRPLVDELHAPINPDLGITRNDGVLLDLTSITLKSVARLELRHQISSTKRGYSSTLEEREDDSSNSLHSETEFCANAIAVEISDKQTGNCVTSSSDEVLLAGETTNTESSGVGSTSRLEADTSLEKDAVTLLPFKANRLPLSESDSDKKEITGGDSGLHDAEVIGETKTYNVEDALAFKPIELQADATSVHESSGCLTSHEGSELDKPYKNSSISSAGTTVNQEQNLDSDVELVGSTASLSSPKDSEAKDVEAILVGEDSNIYVDKESKSDQVLDATNSIGGAEKIRDEKSFCCSCRESLSLGSQFLKQNSNARMSKVMPVSNLVIRPRNSSSFTKYQNRSLPVAATSTVPTDQPTFAQNTLDSTLMYPFYSDNTCSPSPSAQTASNATLRLMGKNLVLNHDEHPQPQTNGLVYQPTISASTAGVLSTSDVQLNHFHYPHPNQLVLRPPAFSHQMPLHLPNPTFGGFTCPESTDSCMTIPYQQIQPTTQEKPITSQEVIVIQDSPERRPDLNGSITDLTTTTLPLFTSSVSPVQSSCFPLQSPVFEVSAASMSLPPNIYPSLSSISYMSRGNNSEYQGPILPSHIVYRSTTGPRTSSVFYSESMH